MLSEQKALDAEKEKKERQLRKRLKQQEKQLKREAYEAMERQKKMMAEETDKALKGVLNKLGIFSFKQRFQRRIKRWVKKLRKNY